MQLTAFTLLFTFLTAVTAHPAPAGEFTLDKPGPCVGGSYDTCKASYVCVQSWPESCHCHNKVVTRCADNCRVMFIPEHYQDCGNTPKGHSNAGHIVRKDAVQGEPITQPIPAPAKRSDVETAHPSELKNVRAPEFKELETFPTSDYSVERPAPRKLISKRCYDSCVGGKMCVMSFPQSCYCQNSNRRACATKCNMRPTGIQNCGALGQDNITEMVKH
ncbi:hypothetical protein BZA77DRAFT_296455 [Pyronema omphalodes]|nr:hypothetical protein BZA77DRAFT_296455 [Pyronema omphalodes]